MTTSQTTDNKVDAKPRLRATGKSATRAADAKISKHERLRLMLARKDGATLEQMCQEFDRQARSARATICGLRKSGHEVLREAGEGGSIYRLRG